MNTLDEKLLKRQDFVDNAIYKLILDVNPSQRKVDWNIEMIGEIRDLLRLWIVERLGITDEMTFYPYIDVDS